MQNISYRYSARLSLSIIVLACMACFFMSCEKSTPPVPPAINFLTGGGYVSHDTIIQAGTKVRVGIRAGAGNANLTYFSVRFNDGTGTILLDTGMNSPTLVYNLEVIKTNAQKETWTFLVMDRNRVRDSVQIVFTKAEASAWGNIRIIDDIILGAQENTTHGSFYSLTGFTVMTLQEAFENQSATDMVYYFGQYEGTLASPAETEAPGFFPGPQGIANWTIKNETRYDTTLIAVGEFDNSDNDSLILAAYEPTAGKKKGKYIVPGMVLSFKSAAGKLGLIKVVDVSPLPVGSLNLSIKIQE